MTTPVYPPYTQDYILVHGLEFVGPHGVYSHEREEGRRFRVDLEVQLGQARTSADDALADTLDYRALAQAVLDVGLGPSHDLIETLAEDMAALIFARHPVARVMLTLRKYADGIPGEPEYVGVRIVRERPCVDDGEEA